MLKNGIKFTGGASKVMAEIILDHLSEDFGWREKNILKNLAEVKLNTEVPNGYIIYCFYDNKGNRFEAGKTPSGYSVTN